MCSILENSDKEFKMILLRHFYIQQTFVLLDNLI